MNNLSNNVKYYQKLLNFDINLDTLDENYQYILNDKYLDPNNYNLELTNILNNYCIHYMYT